MDNKEFDDIIKKRLESLSTEGSDDAWDLFKEKWDHESSVGSDTEVEDIDEDLDAKIKEDMQNLRVPFNSQHWIKLKQQLELEALFKKKLFVAKSLELVILALIVLGVLNLWPIQNDIYQIPVHDLPMVVALPVDKATAEKHAEQEIAKVDYNWYAKQSNSAVKKKDVNHNADVYSRSGSSEKLSKPVLQNSGVSGFDRDVVYPFKYTPIPMAMSVIPFVTTSGLSRTKSKTRSADDIPLAQSPIAALKISNPKLLTTPARVIHPPITTTIKPLPIKTNHTYVSLALGPKMNLVNSPFDPVYGFDPYNTIHTNFNVIATISKEIGPAEIYAGLGYTNTSYEPRLVDEIYESGRSEFNVTRLENITFKTLNVPFGVRMKIIGNDKIDLYASTGLDMNLIAESIYEIQDVPVGNPPPAAKPPSKNEIHSNSKLSTKEFNNGIFSGGSLSDNFYAAASVGLGLNFNFGERAGIFIEPRYSHFISSRGIGPNEDRVHALSVDLGLKYQLN